MSVEPFSKPADAADDAVVASVTERWRSLEQEIAAGQATTIFNPAAEGAAMRRIARSGGAKLADTLVRTWRALAGDMAVARGLKAVYVGGGEAGQALVGARGYFGYGANVVVVTEVREAMEKAAETPGVIACIPWPENAGYGQWWPMLNETRFRELAILTGWPNLPSDPDAMPKAAIVGRIAIQPSGEDDMLVTAHDDARNAVPALRKMGFDADVLMRARSLALIRIRGFVAPDDPRLAGAREAGVDGLRVVGVRPRP